MGVPENTSEQNDTAPRKETRPSPAVVSSKNAPTVSLMNAAAVAANERNNNGEETNLVKRSVDEICSLMAAVHDIREDFLAHGIEFHRLNSLIELGMNEKSSELSKAIDAALRMSADTHGQQAITREALERGLAEIVVIERDLGHVRQVAKKQGLHMQALNHLTQLMRLNPGDGGVQAINTFLAYADASGVPLERLPEIRDQIGSEPKSVLPNVPREERGDSRRALREFCVNAVAGSLLTALVMWMVL